VSRRLSNRLRAGDGVIGVAGGVAPALSGQGLVVVLAEVETELGPGVEVARSGHGTAAGALVLAVADELREGRGTLDGRLVNLGVLPDVVDGAVAGDGAHLLPLSRASAVAGVLLNVVLNERVGGPSVDGDKDRAGGGGGGTAEVDVAVGSGLPSHSDDEVTSVGELDRVAGAAGLVVDVAAGLVVLVVVLAADNVAGGQLEIRSISDSSRSCEAANRGGKGEDDGVEGNHFESC